MFNIPGNICCCQRYLLYFLVLLAASQVSVEMRKKTKKGKTHKALKDKRQTIVYG